MTCMAAQFVDFLMDLATKLQYYILTLVLGLIAIAFVRFRRVRTRNSKSPNVSSDDKVVEFKALLSTAFSDCCWLNWPLTAYNRFRVGGNAEMLFRPINMDQLLQVLNAKPECVKVTPLGMGSNVLIRDGAVPGLVVQIVGRGFAQFQVIDDDSNNTKVVECGAGLSQLKFARLCAKAGVSGLEFFCGIPGTIGGALRMNTGAHGSEVRDRLISATVVDPNGPHVHQLSVSDMKYEHRHCGLPDHWIFVSAKFRGDYLVKSREEIECTIEEMIAYREESQPVNERTAGCTFRNPADHSASAWQLISEAECQDMVLGGAHISPKHCNFFINGGHATAKDLEDLGETVRQKVKQKSGIDLKWEVKRIGIKSKPSSE